MNLSPKWLSAKATGYAHPDKQIRVVFSRPKEQDTFEVLLSGPEAESAIRQMMQAYANSIGKALTFCAYPTEAEEVRMPANYVQAMAVSNE